MESICEPCMPVKPYSFEQFIEEARKIRGDRYQYSDLTYSKKHRRWYIGVTCEKHGTYRQRVDDHLKRMDGCPRCSRSVSRQETSFFDEIGIPLENRQKRMGPYKVDAVDETTKTAYEFLGDFWHGNLKIYKPNNINEIRKLTFKTLYDNTFIKFDELEKLGYKVRYIWEADWNMWKKHRRKGTIDKLPIITHHREKYEKAISDEFYNKPTT
jgi:G:T-mismatch repair DNA endonuclease (very short patch repair protein)